MSETDVLLHLWAKRRPQPPPEVLYPLLFHMLDVAVVAEGLWHRCPHSSARRFCSQQLGLSEAEAGALIPFWVGLHDMGKGAPGFQGKSQVANDLLGPHLSFPQSQQDVPHGTETVATLPQYMKSPFEPEAPRGRLLYTRDRSLGCLVWDHCLGPALSVAGC